MATMYCTLCQRPVEARRHIGAGTVILAFVSAGLSLIAIPFYARRCSICGTKSITAVGAAGSGISPDRFAEVENRLRLMEAELLSTTTELDRVRTERDFYRQLLENPESRRRLPE